MHTRRNLRSRAYLNRVTGTQVCSQCPRNFSRTELLLLSSARGLGGFEGRAGAGRGAARGRRTAHLGAELLVVALGALVQPLRVLQKLLHLPHLPLAAPQLAFQLLHLPPQLGQLRLRGGGWRWRQRRRRRLGRHGVRREAARARLGAALRRRRTPAAPGATRARGQRKAASNPPGRGGPWP